MWVHGLERWVQGAGCKVQGAGCRVQGLRFKVVFRGLRDDGMGMGSSVQVIGFSDKG